MSNNEAFSLTRTPSSISVTGETAKSGPCDGQLTTISASTAHFCSVLFGGRRVQEATGQRQTAKTLRIKCSPQLPKAVAGGSPPPTDSPPQQGILGEHHCKHSTGLRVSCPGDDAGGRALGAVPYRCAVEIIEGKRLCV